MKSRPITSKPVTKNDDDDTNNNNNNNLKPEW
jgi:hypothetical protein